MHFVKQEIKLFMKIILKVQIVPFFLQTAYSLSEWFMQTYGDWNYQHQNFVMPIKEEDKTKKIVVLNKA